MYRVEEMKNVSFEEDRVCKTRSGIERVKREDRRSEMDGEGNGIRIRKDTRNEAIEGLLYLH